MLAASEGMANQSVKVSDLSWMAGQWSTTSDDARTDAYYMTPEAGMMLGLLRVTNAWKVGFFEYQRIIEESGTLVLYPVPFGKPGVSFSLKELASERAVFENPTHPFPKTITFYLDSRGALHIRVEGEQGDQAVTQEIIVSQN